MRKLALSLSSLLAVSAVLPAQASPGEITPFAKDTVFTVANLSNLGIFRAGSTNQRILQINFTKQPGIDAVGEWTAALTVSELSPVYGGSSSAGWQGVVMGKYNTNVTPHTFTPTTDANRMNNVFNGFTFGLQIEPRDALCATVDRRDGMFFSFRPNVNMPFPRPLLILPVTGTPRLNGNYVDPAPMFIDQTTVAVVFTNKSNRIIIRPLRLQFNGAGTVLQSVRMDKEIEVGTFPGKPHAPTPIIDTNGSMQGLLVSVEMSPTDSDLYWLPGLDRADKPVLVWGGAPWQSHGGICGGRIFATSDADMTAAWVSRVSWLMGSKTALGDEATITLGASNPKRPFQATRTMLAISLLVNNGAIPGLTLGGFNGQFGLNGPILIFAPNQQHGDVDDRSFWKQSVPNDNALVGIEVTMQGLSLINGEQPTWTNTATLEFIQ